MLIYLDTNVYMDYFKIRSGRLIPNDEQAFQLLRRVRSCEFHLVFSGLVMTELMQYVPGREVQDLVRSLREKVVLVKTDESDCLKARQFGSGIHYSDALHCVLCSKAGCTLLVTNDRRLREAMLPDVSIVDYSLV